jgi:hypothetical protein
MLSLICALQNKLNKYIKLKEQYPRKPLLRDLPDHEVQRNHSHQEGIFKVLALKYGVPKRTLDTRKHSCYFFSDAHDIKQSWHFRE